jgi:hypothetical protein
MEHWACLRYPVTYQFLYCNGYPQNIILHTTPYSNLGTPDYHAFFRKYLDTTQIPTSRFDWGINFIAIGTLIY